MQRVNIKSAMPFIGFMIFIIAIIFLGREMKQYSFSDIINHVKATNPLIILIAMIFMILNHFALTLYDYLAFRHIKKDLSYKRVALTSLISFIFGNNIGFSGFSSSAVRFRLYSSWKIASSDILEVIMFCLTSFWVGLILDSASNFYIYCSQCFFKSKKHLPRIATSIFT